MKKLIPKLIGFYLNALAWIAPRTAGRIGFNVFCTPIKSPMQQYHLDFLQSGEQFPFLFEGIKLQAYRWGKGEKKVLFLHGWKSHSFRWKKYIEAFPQDQYTLYAFDAPGHGLSEGQYINLVIYADAVLAFIDKMGEAEAVVTHSFGGFATLYALYQNPSLPIRKLVLTGTPGEATDFVAHFRQALNLSDRTMNCVLTYFKKFIDHGPEFFSSARFAMAVKMPGLIIHDEGDPDAPIQHAYEIAKAWKNATLITTTGLGHNLKSPAVVTGIKDFVTNETAGQKPFMVLNKENVPNATPLSIHS